MNKYIFHFVFAWALLNFSRSLLHGQEAIPASLPRAQVELLAVNTSHQNPLPSDNTTNAAGQSSDVEPVRNINSFKTLFARSPFVMASVGEQSPISQRYVITGVVKIGEEARVFLLDQTTKNRLMISASKPDGNVSLVSLQANNDPSKVRVTLRVGGDTGVVGYAKEQSSPGRTAQAEKPPVAAEQNPPAAPAVAEPVAVATPSESPSEARPPAPKHVIIRRAPIPRASSAASQEPAQSP